MLNSLFSVAFYAVRAKLLQNFRFEEKLRQQAIERFEFARFQRCLIGLYFLMSEEAIAQVLNSIPIFRCLFKL